ncbi:MAG: hypothetical protein C4326_07600 [Ignavibacteria bacterium]
MAAIVALTIICVWDGVAQRASSPMAFYEHFFSALLREDPALDSLVHPDDLASARRLGISYEGELHKYLIGYSFEQLARRTIREEGLRYTLTAESLDATHTRLSVEVPSLALNKSFLFERHRLISPLRFATSGWHRIRSAYCEIRLADTTSIHPAAIEGLDRFVQRMIRLMELSSADERLLAEKKIIYVLCRDEAEVERLSGFRSRGMYLIPFDAIVTTYPCHYHEIVHLLMNFALRRLPLYTHPFLQEGSAVAFGGRGGIAPTTLWESGAFLIASSAVDYRDFFRAERFRAADPSFTYPVSGLYVKFLIERYGMNHFLRLYRTYSGTADRVQRMMLHDRDLAPHEAWLAYVDSVAHSSSIRLDAPSPPKGILLQHGDVEIHDAGVWLFIRMKSDFGLRPRTLRKQYVSSLFRAIKPSAEYNGVRFFFVADSQEIVVYDCYTNTSLASYAPGLHLKPQAIERRSGMYAFWIRKDLFPVSVQEMDIVTTFPKHPH